jgi:hypothetical protein
MQSYLRRNLYKPIYILGYKNEDEIDEQAHKLWHELYPDYRDPKNRLKVEIELEKSLDLKPGSITIFCPDKKMNMKRFEALVHPRPDSDIKYLRYILDTNRREEMNVIENRFEQLWKFQVFVDPEQINPSNEFDLQTIELSGRCEELFGFSNEIGKFKVKITPDDIIKDYLIKQWDKEHSNMLIPLEIARDVKINIRYRPTTGIKPEDYYRELIKNRVTSYYMTFGHFNFHNGLN